MHIFVHDKLYSLRTFFGFELIRFCNGKLDEKEIDTKNILDLLKKWDGVFGFIFQSEKEEIEDHILAAAHKRFIARKEKNYDAADAMRELIENAGYIVEDTKDKCTVKKKES